MKTSITKCTDNELTIEIKITLTGSMLESEQMILEACNQVGQLATAESLKVTSNNSKQPLFLIFC